MWDIIVALLIGAAIPLLIQLIQNLQKQKFFHLEQREKIKVIAIEKRLETHQQAFYIWFNLLKVIHTEDENSEKQEILRNAEAFWQSNALYLEKRTRERFRECIDIVSSYKTSIRLAREETDLEIKKRARDSYLDNWYYFMDTLKTIQEEVELEPFKPEINITPEGELLKTKND